MGKLDSHNARIFLIGLLMGCPFEGNPEDCILHHFRKVPIKARVEWSRQLPDEKVQQIVSLHKQCLTRKEEQGGFPV